MVLLNDFQYASSLHTSIILGLVSFLIYTIVAKIIHLRKRFLYYNSLPGETNYSILTGNVHMIPSDGEERLQYFSSLRDKHGGRFARMWSGPLTPLIWLFHPDLLKIFYKSSTPKSRGFGRAYELVLPWIGDGLLTSNGHKWARARRLLTPAFHFEILKSYVKVFNKSTDTLIRKLDVLADSGEKFDISPLFTCFTLETLLKCAMSYEEDVQTVENHPYCQTVKELQDLYTIRLRSIHQWSDFIYKRTPPGRLFFKHCDYVHKVAEDIIQKRKETREREGIPKNKRLDFLDILLSARDEDGKALTDLEIRNEVDTFMFAGHDTTAMTAQWIIYNMAKYPEHQWKVQEGLDQILDGKEDIDWEDFPKLTYLTQCIKETLRLYPPVPFIPRTVTEDMDIDGYRIEKGTNVNLCINHMHHNPLVWENPEEFRPERFLPENLRTKDSFDFTPFSAGSRNCIGQHFALLEEKVVIGRILKRYTVELSKDGPPVKVLPAGVLRSQYGIWIRLKKRHV